MKAIAVSAHRYGSAFGFAGMLLAFQALISIEGTDRSPDRDIFDSGATEALNFGANDLLDAAADAVAFRSPTL